LTKQSKIHTGGNKQLSKNWLSTCKRLKLDPYLSPCTKINSKYIKDLNLRPETLTLLQEKLGKLWKIKA
jgi:hypothetical protein